MAAAQVVYFAEEDGSVPAHEWLRALPEIVRLRFTGRTKRLRELGTDLHRPEADYLRDGVYELRVRHRHVNYRLLYFFCGKYAVLSHGLIKEQGVPSREIERATARRTQFAAHPARHTHDLE